MFLCALEIGHNSVLKNIGGATVPPVSPAPWSLMFLDLFSVAHGNHEETLDVLNCDFSFRVYT